MFAILCGLSASVRCGVFASGVSTLFSDEIMSGKFLAFEFLFNTFQKRFGCCLMSVSKLLKNFSLLFRNIYLTEDRKVLNRCRSRKLFGEALSLCRTESFFLIAFRMDPLNHGAGLRPFIFLIGI